MTNHQMFNLKTKVLCVEARDHFVRAIALFF
jgi:hypothetical protein